MYFHGWAAAHRPWSGIKHVPTRPWSSANMFSGVMNHILLLNNIMDSSGFGRCPQNAMYWKAYCEFGRVGIMVWGCLPGLGLGPLFPLNVNATAFWKVICFHLCGNSLVTALSCASMSVLLFRKTCQVWCGETAQSHGLRTSKHPWGGTLHRLWARPSRKV